jgi:uncharacterized membrane protein
MMRGGATSRPVQIILLVCLALALFLAGFVAGHFVARHGPPPPPKFSAEVMVDHIVRGLPKPDADILRDAFRANEAKLGAALAELEAGRQEVRAKLAAEPFDKAALQSAMDAARDKREALAVTVQGTVMGVIDKLSPEGRARLWSAPGH